MSPKSAFLSEALGAYVEAHANPADGLLRELAEYNAGLGRVSSMQISAAQGAFMTLLARVVAPRFAVEVGTFTGYSSICVARALAPDGQLVCCDVSEEWTTIARQYWERAAVADRIELRLGPAADTLAALPTEQRIDWAFIDADKQGYRAYWDEIVPRLSPGGLVLVDNVLWSGKVVEESVTDDDTVALRAFNDYVLTDDRMETVLLPLADGLTIARRR
jgi:caffeoyl-CoA O-methyltransferase